MRGFLAAAAFLLVGVLSAQGTLLPEVKERRLSNGVRVMMVPRSAGGMVHGALFLRGGRADTGALPAAAAELLVRSLFGPPLPEDLGDGSLDALLSQEEGAFEALRLERIQRGRRPSAHANSEAAELEAILAKVHGDLDAKIDQAKDPFRALGCAGRWTRAEADSLGMGVDLPFSALGAWAKLEARRLQRLQLGRFPFERRRLLAEAQDPKAPRGHAVLLGAAFAGHPYAQVEDLGRPILEALTWSEVRAYGRWLIQPERLLLVLVGDLDLERTVVLMEEGFGGLKGSIEDQGRRESSLLDLPEAPGARRLQASTPDEARLLVAWRIPPGNHPATPGLRVLAEILGGTRGRLVRRLQGAVPLAKRLEVRLGMPGERDANLLVIEVEPLEGHSLDELERAIHGEVLRLQREAFGEGEIRRAQRQLEAGLVRGQEDAAELARNLGRTQAECGDWRLAYRPGQSRQDLGAEEIQELARQYLVPGQTIAVLLEPDPLLDPRDALETQLGRALGELVRRQVEDLGQAEAIVRATLRQLRLLSPAEREQTLRLLQRQVRS